MCFPAVPFKMLVPQDCLEKPDILSSDRACLYSKHPMQVGSSFLRMTKDKYAPLLIFNVF